MTMANFKHIYLKRFSKDLKITKIFVAWLNLKAISQMLCEDESSISFLDI